MSDWNQLYENGGIHLDPTRDLLELFPELIRLGVKTVLDAGCGNGRDGAYLAQEFSVSAVDGSITALKAAKHRSPQLNFSVCDLASLPYQDNSFDFVLAGHSIEYTEHVDKTVAELERVLKPDSPIYVRVLSTQHPFFQKKPDELYGTSVLGYALERNIPVKFFTHDEVKELFRNFTIERLEHRAHKPSRRTNVALNEWVMLAYKK